MKNRTPPLGIAPQYLELEDNRRRVRQSWLKAAWDKYRAACCLKNQLVRKFGLELDQPILTGELYGEPDELWAHFEFVIQRAQSSMYCFFETAPSDSIYFSNGTNERRFESQKDAVAFVGRLVKGLPIELEQA